MGLMTPGAVLVLGDAFTTFATAYVGSNPIALMKDLYGGRGGANLHDLLNQCVRRTVEVAVKGDVIGYI